MFVINKKISSFAKYSSDSYKKDVYYRLLKIVIIGKAVITNILKTNL